MIRIEHLQKAYPNVTPLKDVNAVINKGDVISIIGPSGTGKSTLLRMLNQLEKPTSGNVYLHDECITDPKCDITKVRQRLGMVFQSFNLYESLTVVENIMVGPVKLKGVERQVAYDRAMELLARVGLADKALSYPIELSGGQKQRVAIVRSVAMDPEVLLLDEPTSALDPKMVNEVQQVIADLARSGMTMMIVTHEMSFARNISTRIFYMDEGVIYEEGTPQEIFDNPKREKTKEFVSKINMCEFEVSRAEFNYAHALTVLQDFARNNLLSQRLNHALSLVMEEAFFNGVLDNLDANQKAKAEMIYDQSRFVVQVSLSYEGKGLDPVKEVDEYSRLLIERFTKNYQFSFADGKNHVSFDINA